MKKYSAYNKSLTIVIIALLAGIGIQSVRYSSTDKDAIHLATDLVSRIHLVFDSCKMKVSDVKPRNFNYKVMGEISAYKVVMAKRYLSKDNFFVDCVVYQYDNNESAIKTFDAVAKLEYLDSMFKDYNFLFSSGNSVILIKTGCNQNKKIWEVVIEKMKAGGIVDSGGGIKCTCGGNCDHSDK